METTVPKLSWPIRLTRSGRYAVVEQDSIEEIEQCVAIIATLEKGEIEDLPELGLRPRVLTENTDAQIADMATEIRAIEPRADVDVVIRAATTATDRNIDLTVGRTM